MKGVYYCCGRGIHFIDLAPYPLQYCMLCAFCLYMRTTGLINPVSLGKAKVVVATISYAIHCAIYTTCCKDPLREYPGDLF